MENKTKNNNIKVYLCPNCGGSMKFDIKKQLLCCEYCQTKCEDYKEEKKKIIEYDLDEWINKESVSNWKNEVKVLQCESCGAEIFINNEETSAQCSFCGSPHVTNGNSEGLIKPEGILPFKIEEYRAKEVLEKWIKTRFLAPNNLKYTYSSDRLKAVYVPYWTFDAQTNSYYTGQGGTNYYETEEVDGKKVTKKRTEWNFVSGQVNKFFDDIQVNGSKNFKENITNRIEPFNMNMLVPYNQKYLSGYVAEKYTKGIKSCFEIAKEEMKSNIRNEARNQILLRYDEAIVQNLDVRYSECKFKHILLPVWTAQYDYKGKKYTYMINGESGKVSGSIPYSVVKIIAIIIVILVIVGIIFIIREK